MNCIFAARKIPQGAARRHFLTRTLLLRRAQRAPAAPDRNTDGLTDFSLILLASTTAGKRRRRREPRTTSLSSCNHSKDRNLAPTAVFKPKADAKVQQSWTSCKKYTNFFQQNEKIFGFLDLNQQLLSEKR